MRGKFTGTILGGLLGAGLCLPAAAQPYTPPAVYVGSPGEVGAIVVHPEYRYRNDTFEGIPYTRVYARRVVDTSDLDLRTRWGVNALYFRVKHAAEDACRQLDQLYPQGLRSIDTRDGDCKQRAVRDAMRAAPLGAAVDAAYRGY
jgi:UrcA family protein